MVNNSYEMWQSKSNLQWEYNFFEMKCASTLGTEEKIFLLPTNKWEEKTSPYGNWFVAYTGNTNYFAEFSKQKRNDSSAKNWRVKI